MLRFALAAALAVFATAALAADFPTTPRYTAPAPIVTHNWTGFYLGAHGGVGRVRDQGTVWAATGDVTIADRWHAASGALYGAQAAYRHQFGPVVAGLHLSYSWGGMSGSGGCHERAGVVEIDCPVAIKYRGVGMALGSLGFAHDRWLVSLMGGVAGTHGKAAGTFEVMDLNFADISGKVGHRGLALGAELAYAINQNWSVWARYLRTDFHKESFGFDTRFGGVAMSSEPTMQVVMAGIDYRFNVPWR